MRSQEGKCVSKGVSCNFQTCIHRQTIEAAVTLKARSSELITLGQRQLKENHSVLKLVAGFARAALIA